MTDNRLMKPKKLSSARNSAMDYLSRREHSRSELEQKLSDKGFDAEEIELALDRLSAENLQNDYRFCEAYLRHRISKGFGLIKIKHEMKQKGVSFALLEKAIAESDCDWQEQLKMVAEKKFGDSPAANLKEKQKRTRFLLQRGFAMNDIMRLFDLMLYR